MKTKLLLMLCLFCASISNYAQSSASQSGIAVQGIARDANNTALTKQTLNLTYTLYYRDASNIEQTIYKVTRNVETDAFGVFSDIIDPAAVNNSLFANNVAYLKIEKGTEEISNEKLNHVPYAISANNGVPTGSIMPFIGTVAPEGWALCNGAALPTTAKALIALLGSNNAPNLQGMFLRGTGTSPVNNQAGPALKATQNEELKSHLHGKGTLVTETAGNHNHASGNYDKLLSITGNNTVNSVDGDSAMVQPDLANVAKMSDAGNHTHTISGETASTGGNETRPVNYGVNYIIKL
ncbi:tail fiber protein [Flavobacterium panacagri]|uniref:tail fiber protein n=1 Tax=Flavobacterium panacagri TaxID=3034146 RepID=UPI0025A5CF70|nr:tail fiber protein [Flavobacterium panacagri]